MSTRSRFRRPAACFAAALAAPLIHAQHALEEVRVVGAPLDRSPTEAAQPIGVLAGDTLRRRLGNTLGETLAYELGVSSTYFGPGASRPVIRGLAGARVKVLEDGIDALDAASVSVDHAVGLDPLAAQQIEIFRGPTTLLYGSGAVGGVVNTVTNRIPAAVEEGLDALVELRGDTVSRARSAAVRLDGATNALAWHFDGSRRTADDYEVPNGARLGHHDDEEAAGVVRNSDFATSSAAAGASWIGERGSFGVAVSRLESGYGVPGHVHAEDADGDDADPHHGHADARARIDLAQTRVDVRAERLGLRRFPEIELALGINDYEHVELEDADVGTRVGNDAYEGRVEVVHAPLGLWQGAFGAQLGARELTAIGEDAFMPPTDTRTAGLFVLEHRDLAAWQLSLGARVERVRHDAAGLGSAYDATATSLSAAAIRRLAGDVSVSVNAARAERVPAAEELYSNGPHLASRTFEIGSPLLGVETSNHVDIGVRRTDGRITWALTAFRTDYDGFIHLAATGTVDAETRLPIYAYRQQDARLAGLEAELFARVADVWTGELDVRLFGDTVRARLDNGERLPRIPPRRLGLRLQYHDARLVAGVEAVRYDRQARTAPFETPTGGYTLLGFDVAWTLSTGADRSVDVFLEGTNLLDEEARRHTSIVKDLAPLPGRNVTVGVRVSFRRAPIAAAVR